MNSLLNYDSSSSDSESDNESKTGTETELATNLKSTVEPEAEETAAAKPQTNSKNLSYEERIALKISSFKKNQQQEQLKTKKVALNLFSVGNKAKAYGADKEQKNFYSSRIRVEETFPALGERGVNDGDSEIEQDTDDMPTKKKQKRSQGFEDEANMIDFEVDDFYNKNKEMIETGELNTTEISHKNSKVKYYGGGSSSGQNQLSDIIKFTQQNKEQLQKNVENESAKSKEKGKQYGFR